jgi:hypothetical protein
MVKIEQEFESVLYKSGNPELIAKYNEFKVGINNAFENLAKKYEDVNKHLGEELTTYLNYVSESRTFYNHFENKTYDLKQKL